MSETIDQTVTRLQGSMTSINPTADTAPGSVLNELLVKPAASLQNPIYNSIEALSQQVAFNQALASTVATYSPFIDEIASNALITRNQGTLATGVIQMIVSTSRSYSVPLGTQFIYATTGQIFANTQAYNISATPSGTDLQLFTLGSYYYFLLPVSAVVASSASQVPNGASLALNTGFTFANLVSSTAYGNFTSGLSKEDDKALIARIQIGQTNKTLTSKNSILNTLQGLYPAFQSVGLAGAGDAEMLRSKRNVFGTSTFGMVDVYVRSAIGAESQSHTVYGTKLSAGVWQISLGASDYPGFYNVQSVLPLGSTNMGSLAITSQTYSYAVPASQRVNSVSTAQDARFSVYQTCVITFSYTESPTVADGSTAQFQLLLLRQPYLSEIQALFLSDGSRIAGADYLVKAVNPCFVNMSLLLYKNNATDVIDVQSLQQDIFNYINTIKFGESLYASKIVSICHNYNIKQVDIPFQMNGSILASDGSTINIQSTDLLTIPSQPSIGVSPNTTMFFVDYQTSGVNNIGITVS